MPRILLFLLILVSNPSYSQVGINTSRPSQMLDVNGKIRIGDDQRTATEGAIRLNKEGDFEGYANDQWSSFTKQGRSPLPNNAIPIYGYLLNQFPQQAAAKITLGQFSNLSTFTDVPAGKYVLITSIHVGPFGTGTVTTPYEVQIGRAPANQAIDNATSYTLRGGPESIFYQDPQGILMIIRPGESLKVNVVNASFGVEVKVRGFLVDDLSYD